MKYIIQNSSSVTIIIIKPRPGRTIRAVQKCEFTFFYTASLSKRDLFSKKKKNTVTRFIVGLGKRKVQEDTGGLAYFSLGHYIVRHISSVC